MELSNDMLNELKCIQCEKYLTCAPIHIINTTGEAICGRCTSYENQPTTRNKQYEIIARKVQFPCINSVNGCKVKICFSEEKFNTHEEKCEYRNRICPVGESGECEWIGPWNLLVEHCRKDHPNNVVDNPCKLQHDITKDSLNAYVLTAFNLLFILHVKICVKSAKIYHSLRYLGNPKSASKFKYKLDVQRNDIMLTKPGIVGPEGVLTIQINSCLGLCLNSLIGFLGDYDGTTFTVTVERIEQPKIEIPINTKNETKVCADCNLLQNLKKRTMHERYYCALRTTCFFCDNKTITGNIQEHYFLKHKNDMYEIGSSFRLQGPISKYCFFSSNLGIIVGFFSVKISHFEVEIMTPLSKDHLKKYQCLMHVTNPKTKNEKIFTLIRSTNSTSDWATKIMRSDVPSNSNRFDIIILVNNIL